MKKIWLKTLFKFLIACYLFVPGMELRAQDGGLRNIELPVLVYPVIDVANTGSVSIGIYHSFKGIWHAEVPVPVKEADAMFEAQEDQYFLTGRDLDYDLRQFNADIRIDCFLDTVEVVDTLLRSRQTEEGTAYYYVLPFTMPAVMTITDNRGYLLFTEKLSGCKTDSIMFGRGHERNYLNPGELDEAFRGADIELSLLRRSILALSRTIHDAIFFREGVHSFSISIVPAYGWLPGSSGKAADRFIKAVRIMGKQGMNKRAESLLRSASRNWSDMLEDIALTEGMGSNFNETESRLRANLASASMLLGNHDEARKQVAMALTMADPETMDEEYRYYLKRLERMIIRRQVSLKNRVIDLNLPQLTIAAPVKQVFYPKDIQPIQFLDYSPRRYHDALKLHEAFLSKDPGESMTIFDVLYPH